MKSSWKKSAMVTRSHTRYHLVYGRPVEVKYAVLDPGVAAAEETAEAA